MKRFLPLILALAAFPCGADVPISGLPAASALGGSELVPVVQGGVTSKATVTQITNAVPAVNLAASGPGGVTGNLPNAQVAGLGSLATQSGTFSGVSSGTNTGDQTITLTGDVTGSGAGSFASTIAANAVTNAKAAQMAASSVKCNNTASTANATDCTAITTNTLLAATASAESYGAAPGASGATNTASINNALASGAPTITLNTLGTYTVASSSTVTRPSGNTYAVGLVIPSNTTLRCGPGVILQAAAGQVNPVLIQNSNIAGGNVNIRIEGCTFDGNSANVTSANPTAHDLTGMIGWFQNIAGLTFRDVTFVNPRTWGVGLTQITYGNFNHTRFNYTAAVTANQGGFQFEGQNSQLVVRDTAGNTYDDLVAFVPYSTGGDSQSMNGPGPQTDILIDGVSGDPVSGALHLVRLGDHQSSGYGEARIIVRNLTGGYTDSALISQTASVGTGQPFQGVLIDGVKAFPIAGSSPGNSYIQWTGGADSLTIQNVWRQYNDSAESVRKPVITLNTGNYLHTNFNNWTITDQTAAGVGQNLINLTSVGLFDLNTSNMNAQAAVAGSSDTFFHSDSATTVTRVIGDNIDLVRINQGFNLQGTVSAGFWLSNLYTFNMPGVVFVQGGAHAWPFLVLNNARFDGTNGGTLGVINLNGLTGGIFIQANNVSVSNGANANIVRAGVESIRVQTLSMPVPSGILTPARGDTILDSSNNSDPYRYNGSAWVSWVNPAAPGAIGGTTPAAGAFTTLSATGAGTYAAHYSYTGTAPAVSACGTTPSIDAHATDASGTVTVGTVAAASCTVTFNVAYTTWNHCRVSSQSTIASFAYSYTKTAITVTGTSLVGDLFDYECDGS